MNVMFALVQDASPSPGISTVISPPAASGGETFVAIMAIVLALAAAVVGYRIIRGGRGL